MKVCFDLRALQIGHENRGIGMFAKSLLENLPPADDVEYIFYVFDKNDPIKKLGIAFPHPYELVATKTIKTSVEQPKDFFGMIRLVNHHFSNLKSLRPDVFVQFDFNLGVPKWKSTRNVVIGYDLIPLIMKNDYLPTARYAWTHANGKRVKLKAVMRALYYRYKSRLSYRTFLRAEKIVCISEATAKTFNKLLGIQQSVLEVMHLAPVVSKSAPDHSIADSFKKPYIFYVGGTDSRKGIQDIVYAFNIARGRGLDIGLVLAGNEFKSLKQLPNVEGRNAIINSPYKDDIHLVGFITDEQKSGLYEKAFAFVFCSSYEGFGMPVIEAMTMGCPVISYDNSSIPEISGTAAALVKTGDYVEVAHALSELKDAGVRSAYITKERKQAQQFGWKETAENFLAILGSV